MKTTKLANIAHGFLFIIFLLEPSFIFCQNPVIDSLSQLLPTATTLEDSVELLFKISLDLIRKNNDKSQSYSNKIKELSEVREYPKGLIMHHLSNHTYLLTRNKIEESKNEAKAGLAIALKYDLKTETAKCLNSVGMCFYRISKLDSSIYYILQATKIMEELGEQKSAAAGYL